MSNKMKFANRHDELPGYAITGLRQQRHEVVTAHQVTGADKHEDRGARLLELRFERTQPCIVSLRDERGIQARMLVELPQQDLRKDVDVAATPGTDDPGPLGFPLASR